MLAGARLVLHLLAQRDDRRVHAQLQDGVDLAAGVLLQLDQAIDVPWVQHERLLADGIRAGTQGKTHVRVMQVVGRADGHIVHLVRVVTATQLVEVAIETLELGKEVGIGIIAVDHADRVVLVQRRHQLVAGGLDGLHVTRSDVSSRAYQRKILHVTSSQTTRPESNQRKFHTLSQERRSRREPRPDGRSYGKSRRAFYDGGQPLTRRAPTPPAPAAHYLPSPSACTIGVFRAWRATCHKPVATFSLYCCWRCRPPRSRPWPPAGSIPATCAPVTHCRKQLTAANATGPSPPGQPHARRTTARSTPSPSPSASTRRAAPR